MPPRKLRPVLSTGPREIAGRPLLEAPPPPVWMRPLAKAKFTETAEYLVGIGSITAAELPLVEMFAVAYCHFVEAETMLAGDPLTYRAVLNRQGDEASAVALPAAAQAAKAVDQMRRIGAALGLAPTERAKLPATRAPGPVDPMDELLERVGFPV